MAYETVAWMYALTALFLCNLDDSVAVEIGRRFAEVHGVGRAQGML